MTVEEMISKLKNFPMNAEVYNETDESTFLISSMWYSSIDNEVILSDAE